MIESLAYTVAAGGVLYLTIEAEIKICSELDFPLANAIVAYAEARDDE